MSNRILINRGGFLIAARHTRFLCGDTAGLQRRAVPAQRRERVVTNWRPLHYDVSLTFNDAMTEIASARNGSDAARAEANVTKIDFDFGEMPITSVTVGGKPARYQRTSNTLDVMLPAPRETALVEFAISYRASRKTG